MASIKLKHQNSKAEILFNDTLNRDNVIKLSEILELAFSYYHYNEAEIKINSPGGEGSSMYFLVNTISKFKAEGKKIGITALFEAFSAGAFLLSCGSIGKRKAHHNAKLLYHYARIPIKNSVLTEESIQRFSDMLKKESEVFLFAITEPAINTVNNYKKILSNSIFNKVISKFLMQANEMGLISQKSIRKFDEGRFRKTLKTVYSELFKKDVVITPKTALNLFLIDKII